MMFVQSVSTSYLMEKQKGIPDPEVCLGKGAHISGSLGIFLKEMFFTFILHSYTAALNPK